MGRVVVVTGGNRGIGAAIATAFISLGDTVAVLSRSGEAPAGAHGFPCDVANTESVEAAFDAVEAAFGPAEVVVANAGVTKDTLFLRMTDEDIDQVLNTNLFGALRVARRAAKAMLKLRRGRIIFIGSVVGMLGSAGQVNYSASKSALVGASRSLARELGGRGITANVIAPGFVDTDMTAVLSDEQKKSIVGNVPLGRYASVDEIAGVTTFLASESASYITGALIPVDGGLGMGH
jgi:3-oxoacyl-[acyl-carrier protein] reductase